MNQRFSIFGFGVKLGAGFTVGSFLGLGIMAGSAIVGSYILGKIGPNKKTKEKEEVKDAGDTESADNE